MIEETTTNVRGWGSFLFVGGCIALVTPFAPLGAILAVVGGCMWALAPATQPATQQMVDEVSAGGWGCGPLLTVLAVVGVLFATLAVLLVAVVGA